jgi:hypothetical protein
VRGEVAGAIRLEWLLKVVVMTDTTRLGVRLRRPEGPAERTLR